MALMKFKRSAVPAKVPSIADLALGELAINTYDGKLFLKKNDGTEAIVEIGAGGGGGSGTVTSVSGTGSVSGLTLSGTVTTSGSLTLGGTLALTSGDITGGLGFTPYNASNPAGYTSNVGTVTSVSGTGTVNGLTLTGAVTSSGSLTLGGTLSGIDLSTQITGTLGIANGGTGATTAVNARSNLGAAASGANADITSLTGITGGISSPDFVQFDTTATVTPATGRLYFNDGEGGLSYTLKGGNVVQEVGQSQQVLIYNGTGAALTKGQVVYSNGAQGQRPTVALALATGDATSARTLGIVAEAIADGAEGWVSTLGIVENIDTSAFAAGAQLYLSGTTAGALTATKPVAPLHMVYVARCIKSHATSGRLFVTVQNGYELDELHDVAAVSPSNGQTIVFNSTTGLWEKNTVSLIDGVNGTLPATNGGTGITAVGAAGNVLTSDGTAWVSSLPASGGLTYTTVKTANFTALVNTGVQTDTSGGAFTVTLPASPAVGAQVVVVDSANSWATNNLTIGRNGSTIEGASSDLTCDISGVSVQLVYSGTTWDVYAQLGGATGGLVEVTGGGTGATSLTGYVKGNGVSALTASATIPTSDLTGTLLVENGGTGVTTSTGSGSTVRSSQPSFGSTIGVGGATASTSGSGISFPASQSASTDPSTLDDYEEGSCTITLQDSAGNSATMGSSNVFRYIKIGAFVHVSGTLNWTSISALAAGSRIQFHGLPFVVNNVGNYRAPALFGSSASGSFNITRAEIAGGADNGNTFIFGTRVSGNNVDGDMVPANLGSSGTLYGFQINYTTTF